MATHRKLPAEKKNVVLPTVTSLARYLNKNVSFLWDPEEPLRSYGACTAVKIIRFSLERIPGCQRGIREEFVKTYMAKDFTFALRDLTGEPWFLSSSKIVSSPDKFRFPPPPTLCQHSFYNNSSRVVVWTSSLMHYWAKMSVKLSSVVQK